MGIGRLADLSVVIIGGTAGIGLAAAQACLGEGALLTVVGRETDDLDNVARELGTGTGVLTGDAREPGVAERAIEQAVKIFGRLDAVFHVAGGSGRRFGDGPLDQITDNGWTQTIDVNLKSLFNTNRAAARHFLGAGHGGSVLNMSSVLGFSPSPTHFATHAYAAAKAGANGLTTACASYYARHSIRFNAIAPGLVRTPAAQRAASDPVIAEYIRRKQPLDGGRIGEPDDLNSAVIYLLSPESRFVTGQVLSVDGGWSVSEA
jgi:NAD(P)-dependent dehydrogenase (short-subunit alcohol dehydrogenase family)